jgi:hypothetical protein
MNTTLTPTDELDIATTIRSDLWNTMTLGQLTQQQELIIGKISLVYQMTGFNANPSINNIYAALQVALTDLNRLIDSRAKRT